MINQIILTLIVFNDLLNHNKFQELEQGPYPTEYTGILENNYSFLNQANRVLPNTKQVVHENVKEVSFRPEAQKQRSLTNVEQEKKLKRHSMKPSVSSKKVAA